MQKPPSRVTSGPDGPVDARPLSPRFRAALGELARLDKVNLGSALRAILAVDAEALEVSRASYWELAPDHVVLHCRMLYQREGGRYLEGGVLHAADIPGYLGAMLEGLPIAVDDALVDPRTCEMLESYVRPAGIRAILDVPVWCRGKLAGVVCHEQVGSARTWTLAEQDFARGIGNMVSLAISESERHLAEEGARLAAIGALAAGVAHEINNPLTYINANLTTVLEELETDSCDRAELRASCCATRTRGPSGCGASSRTSPSSPARASSRWRTSRSTRCSTNRSSGWRASSRIARRWSGSTARSLGSGSTGTGWGSSS